MPRIRSFGTFLLILWLASLTLSCSLYLTCLQPSRMSALLGSVLENNPLGAFTAGNCSLRLLPLPSVTLENLAFRGDSIKNFAFQSRKVMLAFSWGSLLRLRPVIRSVTLEEPEFLLEGGTPAHFPAAGASGAEAPSLDALTDPLGMKVSVLHGSATFRTASGDVLTMQGIEGSFHSPALLRGSLDLQIPLIRYETPSGLDVSGSASLRIRDLHRSHDEWTCEASSRTSMQMQSLEQVLGHPIAQAYRYFPMPEPATLESSVRLRFASASQYSAEGTLTAHAVLPMNGHDVPIVATLPFAASSSSPEIRVSGAAFRMDGDNATLNGSLKLEEDGLPVFTGRADIHHFSLIRWFSFGRQMDPGLQKALDNITATFDGMTLSARGVWVQDLKGQVCGMDFSGRGGCKKYAEPFIDIAIHTKHAELNKLFTELRGVVPDMSHLPPPVLHDDDEEDDQTPSRVGYDIHVTSERTSILDFDTGGADIHVLPANPGVLLDIAVPDFYSGSVTSKTYLRDKVRVDASLKNISLKQFSQVLAGYDAVSGRLENGSLTVDFDPGSGLHILHTLHIAATGSIRKGYFKNRQSQSMPFNSGRLAINARVTTKEQKKLPQRINFTGKWDVSLDDSEYYTRAFSDNATLTFSTAYWLPESMTRQNATAEMTVKSQKDAFRNLRISGPVSFSVPGNTLEYSNATVKNDFFSARGSAIVKNPAGGAWQISGTAEAQTPSLHRLLNSRDVSDAAGFSARNLDSASLQAQFKASPSQFALEGIHADIGGAIITGQLSGTMKGKPSLRGNLRVSSLDVSKYLPQDQKGDARTPLPISALTAANAELKLFFSRLRAVSTTLADASIDVSLKNGNFVAPFKAKFFGGGTLEGSFAATAVDARQADLYLHAQSSSVNMLNLSRDRNQSTLISGTGTASAVLNSRQAFWDDWKKKLNGSLMVGIDKGAIRTTDQKGTSETPFSKMSMTAALHNGILTCSDFLLDGTFTDIRGAGKINLGTQKIDASADITLAGIPKIPVTISGSVLDPKTDYKFFGAITGTAGNIGSSVFGLLGGIISAPFKLLSGTK